MPINQSDFASLTDDLQSIFNESAKNKIADSVGMKVFNVGDTGRRTIDHLILHGGGGIQKVTPGQDLPNMTLNEGDSIAWTQEYYGGLVSVDKEMRLFDLYEQIEKLVSSHTDDAFDKVDQSYADRLVNGWSNSYTDPYSETQSGLGPDGVCLFSSSHTNNINSDNESNVISDGTNTNPALSRDAILYARNQQAGVYTDPKGIMRPINLNTVLVPPALEDLALRIVNSQFLPGSANNDINPLKGKMKVQKWNRLQTSSGGTDASAYWYLYDSRLVGETLQSRFAERPSLDPPDVVYKNKNWDYSLDFFYFVGTGFPLYIFGSKGDES